MKFGSSSTKESPVNLRVNQFLCDVLDEHLNKFIVFVPSFVRYWNEMNERTRHFYVNRKTHKENEKEEKELNKKKKKKGRWLLLPQSKKRLSNIPLFGHVSLFMFSYCDGRAMVHQPTPKASGISFTFSLHHEIEFFFFSILNLALIVF